MRGVTAAVLLLSLAVAGCGSGGPLVAVGADPPDGAEHVGKTGTKRRPGDPSSGIPLYRVRAAEGSDLSFAVVVRNDSSAEVRVTGVEADPDRDGAFVPAGLDGAPVRISPGASDDVRVLGRVDGCRYGGQAVPLAGPHLKLREGGDATDQEIQLPIEVEVVTSGC